MIHNLLAPFSNYSPDLANYDFWLKDELGDETLWTLSWMWWGSWWQYQERTFAIYFENVKDNETNVYSIKGNIMKETKVPFPSVGTRFLLIFNDDWIFFLDELT